MADNMPYYNTVTCDGHYCPQDCERCPYEDEAMEFCNKQEELEDVPWDWLMKFARKDSYRPLSVIAFLDDARNAFTKEMMEDPPFEPPDDMLEVGFDPYLGCYTDDC